jgi:Icc-related predicted phosphoesterase
MQEKQTKYVAAIADIYVKETDTGQWTDFFKKVSERADVLCLCGDLTNTGDETEAQVLADELHACSIPVIAVLGNHDYEKARHKLIRSILQKTGVHMLDGEAIVIGGIGFAGVKGFGGGFDRYMLSMFGEGAMKAFVQEAVDEALHLERALAVIDQDYTDIEKKIALMHYAPIKETIQGEPETLFPFLGSSRLAEPLVSRNVYATFHGHAQMGKLEGTAPNGVKVYNVSRPVLSRSGYELPFFLLEL